jgi:hypothetical protein
MNAKQLFQLSIVAAALVTATPFAAAQDQAVSRADVKAGVMQARARGELVPAGEAVQPFAAFVASGERSRQDVRAEVLQARADRELVPAGQGALFDAAMPAPSLLARAEVKEGVRVARQRGELIPAGQGAGPVERTAHGYPARSSSYASNRPR